MSRLWDILTGGKLTGWKRRAYQATVLLLVLAVGAFVVTTSGIVPIKASSGHWPITAWFLNYSMKQSVATHTLGMEVPPLDDESQVIKGAAYYEVGCAPCHGRPDHPHPRVAGAMTPRPPYLPPKVDQWEPQELFYIAKHGVKFTGMPAFPSQQRDDEIWAVVAFLQRLPSLDAAEYRSLVGETSPNEEPTALHGLSPVESGSIAGIVAENCGRCHGADGLGRGTGAFPRLAGQRAAYFTAAMQAYTAGKRNSGIMEPIAAGLTDGQLRQLADYYAKLDAASDDETGDRDQDAIRRGAAIAQEGLPQKRIPACVDCHGPASKPINQHYPQLAGQYSRYLVLQLSLFQNQHRGGTEYAHLMQTIARRLTSEQIQDVAAYYESLGFDPVE